MNPNKNDFSHTVIGLAIELHRELGPGLLESAYEECLAYELKQSSIKFVRQEPVPVDLHEAGKEISRVFSSIQRTNPEDGT
jgi:GxxExxY protein